MERKFGKNENYNINIITKNNQHKNIKDTKKGITLIALVITIIVLLILAGVSIATLTGPNGILTQANKAKEATEKARQEEQDKLANIESYINDFGQSIFSESEGVNAPKLAEGMIPIKYVNGNWVITTQEDPDWYEYINGKNWANVMLSDGRYKTSSKDYNTDGTTIVNDGTNGTANELGSMFVWIPRYAYSINEYKTAKNIEGSTANITTVTFLKGTSLEDKDGNRYATDYSTDEMESKKGTATPSIVHPAFNFGGKSLSGIWVAKFEAGMKEDNTNFYANNNVGNKTVKILPNYESWRYIQVGNMFTNCLNMKSNVEYGLNSTADSHLMKNNEWGAVAYLSASQYGTIPTRNVSGSEASNKYQVTEDGKVVDKHHSYTGNGDYKTNVKQSTTGNETGIYDLSGGAWEYVAAYYDNGHRNISGQGTSNYFTNNKVKTEYQKYWEKYEVGQTEIAKSVNDDFWNLGKEANPIRMQITKQRYDLMKGVKGDAMYEVINTYSYHGKKEDGNNEWGMHESFIGAEYGRSYYNSDYVLIGNCALPFLPRGGDWSNRDSAGVFASGGGYGSAGNALGFRPVLLT